MKKMYTAKHLCLLALSLTLSHLLAAQEVAVSGKVTDASDGSPIPGVNIFIQGTSSGTVSDNDGNYRLSAPQGSTLVYSFVGYETQEVAVGSRSVIDVQMTPDVRQLSEIVVVGYGEQRKEDLTGSVTAISNRDFNKGVLASPQDALIGKIAGVQIVSNSGAPGSGSTIRIRGGSSMSANNEPLFIIDGFPVDNTVRANKTSALSGMPNPLAAINPNDIESVTVLKDASATAIYGSRASNGVIIITTKKGREGKPQLSYAGQAGVSSPVKYIDVFSADEFRALAADLTEAGTVGLNADALNRLGDADTDWQREIYQNAISHDHNLSLTGSFKNLPYRISYGYTDEQGILRTSEMKRHTVDISLTPSLLNDQLKITANVKGTLAKHNFGEQDAIGAAVAYDPTQPIRNGNTRFGGYHTWVVLSDTLPDGSLDPNGDPNPIGVSNPVALLEQTDDRSTVKRTISNIAADYKLPFLPDLRAHINAGIDYASSEGHDYAPDNAAWTFRSGIGRRNNYTADNRSELLEFYLNYLKDLKDHTFDITGGYSWQHFRREGTDYNRNGDETVVSDSSAFIEENYLVSFFGRFNYTFKDKYLLTATLRNDGSSRFSKENRWGFFPAVALAWRINNEPFLANSRALSQLKLRAGYGITGQQDIGTNAYPYLAIYRQSTATAQYQLGETFYPTLRPDPYDANIKWEETTTYNIGLDVGFFNDKLSLIVDAYHRETKDLINFIPIPAGSNFSNYLTTNVGSLENRGVEVTLNAIPVASSDFMWSVGANLTYNENKITKLTATDDPDYPGVDVGNISGGVGNKIQNHNIGFPAYSFYVFEQVYDEDGMPIEGLYVDRTGEGGVVISNNLNKYRYQTPAPEYLVGVNSSLNYKNIDLSFSGRFSFNNYVYNNVMSERAIYSAIYNQSGFFNNLPRAVNDTRFVNQQLWSDHYVENASFFKMDNISLGYSFDQLLSQRLQARISLTVTNAFTITNYSGLDPEATRGVTSGSEISTGIDNSIYPQPRTFLLGLNLTY